MRPRMIGLYALAQMERDGAVHGYLLSRRIAEKTQGAWTPSPGTIYPSLRTLVARGLARSVGAGRRREYRITPRGRAVLRRIRRRVDPGTPGAPDLTVLWAEVAGTDGVEALLLRRLRRTLDGISAALAVGRSSEGAGPTRDALRAGAIRELQSRLAALRRTGTRVAAARRGRRRRTGR